MKGQPHQEAVDAYRGNICQRTLPRRDKRLEHKAAVRFLDRPRARTESGLPRQDGIRRARAVRVARARPPRQMTSN